MPAATFDGRSFMLDGRRIWLVSGSIHYARVPHEQWEQRIHAAKLAGLNTIETPVFWNRHEARPGQFDFKGDKDLRRFVQLIGQAGMYCILRPGPFIGQNWDCGGLPPWLMGVKGVKLRVANGPFLEACSRYLTAVAGQVRDLQATSPPKGGPVVLVQNEEGWTCGDDAAAAAYLGEIHRYLREAGINVPVINANNLWESAEGEVDCWTGGGDLLATVRQLAAVKPDRPRLVVEFNVGAPAAWGQAAPDPERPELIEQRLAQILAAGGQYNIQPFHAGTNFGFWGGRLPEVPGAYAPPAANHGAILTETGVPGPAYSAVRRISTFASRFGRLFANLDPEFRPVVAAPRTVEADGEAGGRGGRAGRGGEWSDGPLVVHATGAQGGVAFIFRGSEKAPSKLRLLLPHGGDMAVDTGGAPLTWCLFDTSISGRAQLDYSSLSAFAAVGKVLVLFGEPGVEGSVSINGSPLPVAVPRGKTPGVVQHEGITLVLCSREQLDTVFAADDAVYLGVGGLTPAGQPMALDGERKCTRIGADGVSAQVPTVQAVVHTRSDRLTISDWEPAPTDEYVSGSSARFAAISGPTDLTTLGSPFGYGWYRIKLKSAGGKAQIAAPQGADRLHLSLDGESVGVLGSGPGAEPEAALHLKKGTNTLVVLAENLGRVAGGATLGEPKGLWGDIWEVHAIRAGRGTVKPGDPVDVLAFRTPLWEVQTDDVTVSDRLTWTITHRKKNPIIVGIGPFSGRGLLLVNNKPVAFLERGGGERHLLMPEQLKAGANLVQIALLPELGGADTEAVYRELADGVTFMDCVASLTAKADWAFARWEPPRASAYGKSKGEGGPTWWRAKFGKITGAEPLFFDATGLTKGQLYVNGRHVCRYFVATAGGKHVGPQTLYSIPSPWLHAEQDNDLLIFDEHGGSPQRTRLVHG